MVQIFVLTFYFLRSLLILLRPSGAKTLMAENVMLRKQLIVIARHRKKPPNLSGSSPVLVGVESSNSKGYNGSMNQQESWNYERVHPTFRHQIP